MQRGTDGLGAVLQHRDLHRGRQHAFELRQGVDDPVHGLDDIRPRLAEHHHVQPLLVTGPGLDVGVLGAVDDLGDILQLHRCAVAIGHDQLRVVGGMEQLVVGRQGRHAVVAIQRTLGQVEAGLLDGQAQVGEGQADGGEFFRLRLDADRRALLAGDVDQADTIDLAQLPGQQGFGVVAQFVGRHLFGTDGENQHRAVGRVDLAPGRRAGHVLRQPGGGGVDRGLDFLGGGVDVLVEGELQDQVGRAQGAAGGHLGHAGNGAELHFKRGGDRGRHGFRAGAGQLRGDLDGRKVGFRQRRDRQLRKRHDAEQHQGEGQQQGGDGAFDAPAKNAATAIGQGGIHGCVLASARARSSAGGAASSTSTRAPGLSRDWPSATRRSLTCTPLITMSWLS